MPFGQVEKKEKFEKLCRQLLAFETGTHQIVVPDIVRSHYSVIDIVIENESPNYIMKVLHYDSLVHPKTKALTMKHVPA